MIDSYAILILPHIASTMGVFLMKQYMEGSIPDALLEAAKIDGASIPRIFFQIVVPLIKPCILTLGGNSNYDATSDPYVFYYSKRCYGVNEQCWYQRIGG